MSLTPNKIRNNLARLNQEVSDTFNEIFILNTSPDRDSAEIERLLTRLKTDCVMIGRLEANLFYRGES